MRHPKKTYPKVFSIFFGLLAAALILFLGWLSFQPTQLEEPSRTEDTKSIRLMRVVLPFPGRRAI